MTGESILYHVSSSILVFVQYNTHSFKNKWTETFSTFDYDGKALISSRKLVLLWIVLPPSNTWNFPALFLLKSLICADVCLQGWYSTIGHMDLHIVIEPERWGTPLLRRWYHQVYTLFQKRLYLWTQSNDDVDERFEELCGTLPTPNNCRPPYYAQRDIHSQSGYSPGQLTMIGDSHYREKSHSRWGSTDV